MNQTGTISRDDAGNVILEELGVTTRYTLDEFFKIMHPMKCRRCGGRMEKGIVMDQTWVGSEDLGAVCTLSPGGQGKLVNCLKCRDCGHSVV